MLRVYIHCFSYSISYSTQQIPNFYLFVIYAWANTECGMEHVRKNKTLTVFDATDISQNFYLPF